MNLLKTKIISTFAIFVLCFVVHFGYDILKSSITAIFFPVNESIWEHAKMLYTAIIIYGIIDFIVMKNLNIKFNNFWFSLALTSIISIPMFLLLYLPLYYKIGPKMFINFGILFITIILTQVIAYYIQNSKPIRICSAISVVLIIIMYIAFGYLTYHPIENDLFFDTQNEKYGLTVYRLKQKDTKVSFNLYKTLMH